MLLEQSPRLHINRHQQLLRFFFFLHRLFFFDTTTTTITTQLFGFFFLFVVGIVRFVLLFFDLILFFTGPCFIGDPGVGNSIFVAVNVFENGFNVRVFTNEFEGSFGANALDAVAIIAAQQDAQVDKLIVVEVQSLQSLFVIHGLNVGFGGIGKGHFAQQNGSAKGEGVHVFRGGRVYRARTGQGGCLGFRLTGCPHYGHTHEIQQSNTVLILLGSGSNQPFGLLVLFLHVSVFLRILESRLCLFPLFPAFHQFTTLEVGRLAIKDIDGPNSLRQEPNGSIEETLNVRCRFSLRIGQHGRCHIRIVARRPHRNQKLINRHTRINRNLPSLQRR
mmetsp:Transcript_21302/g.38507  ORF Transcript_21302/g.38507 Transcript_21302/m.38507 type:complete len:333 (-) Transcript_21302:194-1192(-)